MNQKKYTISEASEILGYEPHVLRYYENEFDIKVPRNKGNRRQYFIKEIETFQYVKDLKEQGFNNTQIKQILKSPTITEGENDVHDITVRENVNEVALSLEYLHQNFASNFNEISLSLKDLKQDIEELKQCQFNDEDKDILLTENAKLKMRLKEKTYELVDIKDKFSKLEKKKFLFKKLFK